MASILTENQKHVNQIFSNGYDTNSNLNTIDPNYSSQLTKLIQYKSIPYRHTIQTGKTNQSVLAKLHHKKEKQNILNNGNVHVSQDYSANRSQTASYLEGESNSRSLTKQNRYKSYKNKNESFYEVQQEPNQKRYNTSHKRYLFTNISDFENNSIQGQEINSSTDQLWNRNNQIHSQSTIKKQKNLLSFRDNLQNSYVSIQTREDVALAKKLELIMGHRNQSHRSTKETSKSLNKSQIIVVNNSKSRTNNLNEISNNNISLETEQQKLGEQSLYDLQINFKQTKRLSTQVFKQNSQNSDYEINQNSSKKDVFNYLKNKIFSKQVSQDDKKNNSSFRISKYSSKLNNSYLNFKNDATNTSESQFKYPPPPLTADMIVREKRIRFSQSQGKRDKKRYNFYEKFSEKLKQSILMTEMQQSYYLQQSEQSNLQQLNKYQNQQIIHEKNDSMHLQMKYNPIQRGKKMFPSLDTQLDSNKCEVLVAKYVNKSIFGDNYLSINLKKQENQNKEKLNHSIQAQPEPNNVDFQSDLQFQINQEQQSSIVQDQVSISNVFYQGQQLKNNSSKKLHLIKLNKNSTKKLLQDSNNNSQNSQFDLKLNQEQEEQVIKMQHQSYINFQNKASFDQDDPDLREYLSENKISTQNLEILGSDYS